MVHLARTRSKPAAGKIAGSSNIISLYGLLDDPKVILNMHAPLLEQDRDEAITQAFHFALLHNRANAVSTLLDFNANASKLYKVSTSDYKVSRWPLFALVAANGRQ